MERMYLSKYYSYKQAVDAVGDEERLLTLLTDGDLVAEGRSFRFVPNDFGEDEESLGDYYEMTPLDWEYHITSENVQGPPFKNRDLFDSQRVDGTKCVRILKTDLSQFLETLGTIPGKPGRPRNSGSYSTDHFFKFLDSFPQNYFLETKSISEIIREIVRKNYKASKNFDGKVTETGRTPSKNWMREKIGEYKSSRGFLS